MKTNVVSLKSLSRYCALFCTALVLFTLFLSLPIRYAAADAKSTVKDRCSQEPNCLVAYLTGDTSGNITVKAVRQQGGQDHEYELKKVDNDPGVYAAFKVTPVSGSGMAQNTKITTYLFDVTVYRDGTQVGETYTESLNSLNLPYNLPTFKIPKPGEQPAPSDADVKIEGGLYARVDKSSAWQAGQPANSGTSLSPAITVRSKDGSISRSASVCAGNFSPSLAVPPGKYTIQTNYYIGSSQVTYILQDQQIDKTRNKLYLTFDESESDHTKRAERLNEPPAGISRANANFAGCDSTSNSGGNDDTGQCDSDGGVLSFFLCPVINGLAEASDGIFNSFVKPFLQTSTINISDNGSPLVKAWSSFRLIANLLLLLALIAAPLGRLVGDGNAYAIKKMVPRLLLATILINLSIYIVAGLLDIFNILGHTLSDFMLAPFKEADALSVKLNVASSALGLTALVAAFFVAKIGGGAFLMFLLVFVLVPTMITFLSVFVTLIIRQGLILFLIIVSPIAFVLYALPNTEAYFKKWWDLLIKTLMVYPIIVVLFAMSQILAGTISHANKGTGLRATLADIAAMVAMLIPLFLIPFAFKVAGGTIATLSGALTGMVDKAKERGFMAKTRERTKIGLNEAYLVKRAQTVRSLNKKSQGAGFVRKRALRFAARQVGGHNIFAAESARQAQVNKDFELLTSTDDSEARALSVNKEYADNLDNWSVDSEGRRTNGEVRIDENGKREYKTLGGSWASESAVDKAHDRWGGSVAAKQWVLNYEMQKAVTQDDQDHLQATYKQVAQGKGGWEFTSEQGAAVWKGAAFANQNQNRQWKHYGFSGGELKLDELAFTQEVDERQGNREMLEQNADTWTTLSQIVQKANTVVDPGNTDAGLTVNDGESPGEFALRVSQARARANEVLDRASRIAYATEQAARYDTGLRPGEDGEMIQTGPARGRAPGSGAAGRVQQEVQAFLATNRQYGRAYSPITNSPDASNQRRTEDGLNQRRSDTDNYGRQTTPRDQ